MKNVKRVLALFLCVLMSFSMLTGVVLPAGAVEDETDSYAVVTGTENEQGYIVPDSNVMFIFAAQPEGASADGFAYTYPGNNKTYWLNWDSNAKTFSASNIETKVESYSKAWANDTTGAVCRDIVFVFAPGSYAGINLRYCTPTSRAPSGTNPTVDELPNVYLYGAKAGVNPVSADRSTKAAATTVANGRSINSADGESVITKDVLYPATCNFYMIGFSATGKGTPVARAEAKNVNVYVKDHYQSKISQPTFHTAILRSFSGANAMYEFENVYFDMSLVTDATGNAPSLICNKLVFNNCVFSNTLQDSVQMLSWLPYRKSEISAYKNFYGQYYTNPILQFNNSVFSDWNETAIINASIGANTYSYGSFATKVSFSGNSVFDCGQTAENSTVFKIDATERVSDFDISIQNNTFNFSDELFGIGATGKSYAIDLAEYTPTTKTTKITFVDNTINVPSDGNTKVFTGVNYDCTGWTKSGNILKTNNGETLKIDYPILGHDESDMIIDVPPTVTEEGAGHTVCIKCGDEFEYVLEPGLAQIDTTIYTTLADALAVAKEGDTIVLRGNAEQNNVAIQPGVTLNLNGNKLTADYVVGFKTSAIIDSSEDNTGKLMVDKIAVALDRQNQGYIPVYDQDGYVFTTIGLTGRSIFTSADKFVFSPIFESFAHDALYVGKADSGIEIIVRLKWKREGNYDGVQEFIYLDDKVQRVIDSYVAEKSDYKLAFTAEFSGKEAEGNPDMDVAAVIRSAAGVEIDTSSLEFDEDNIVFSFGALSDTHVRHPDASVAEAEKFKAALELLKTKALENDSDGLDAIAVAGDLVDMGRTNQADVFIDIIKEAGIDTAMLSLGNHDMYSVGSTKYDAALLSYYAENLGDIFTKNATDMSMIEKDAYHCVVDGNHFIMLRPNPEDLKGNQNYFPFEQDVLDWLDATLKKITAADPTSYVFLVTHVPAYQTVYQTHLNWSNYVTKNLSPVIDKYPQVVLFSGHLHSTLVEERSIMQTKFTSVVSGATNSTGQRWDGTEEVQNIESKRGSILLVQIDGNGNLRLTRMFIHDGSMIKEPWEISHPTADNAHLVKYSKATRQVANVGPTLDGQLTATATSVAAETGFTATVELSFAAGEDDDFVHHYQITATNLTTGEAKVFNRGSDFVAFNDPAMMLNEVAYSISLTCAEAAEYSIDVVAVDSWDAESEKISCNLAVTAPAA